MTYFVNGSLTARANDGELVAIPMPGHCAIVRAVIGASYSAPVYVDCPWASLDPASSKSDYSKKTLPPLASAR